jgi:hypothetical protein
MSPHLPATIARASRRSRLLVVAIVMGLLLAACGDATPSVAPTSSAAANGSAQPASPTTAASPTTPAASASGAPATGSPPAPSASPEASADAESSAAYQLIERQVAAIRGLNPTKPVPRRLIDADELRKLLTADFDKSTPPEYVAATERLYKALGLIPADSDLRKLTLDLLSGGVVGFYRNDEGALYVLSKEGKPGVNERFTFAHEFDHALQDQHFSVFRDQKDVLDQGDRLLARQAVYEGDATLLMTKWASENLDQAELLELVKGSTDPVAQALLNGMPAILKETLVYPYTTGLSWIQRVQAEGGWQSVDSVYARMPESTEQILHPEKYTARERPVAVTLPADLATRLGTGWSVPLMDTFGEFQTGIWLREGGVEIAEATDAAAGWGGDRLGVMNGPDGAWAMAWKTEWDTAKDAAAFEQAATKALEKAGGVRKVLPGESEKTRWVLVADDDATLGRVANVLGLAG